MNHIICSISKKNPVKDLESDHPDHPSYLIGHWDHSGPVESSSNRASTSHQEFQSPIPRGSMISLSQTQEPFSIRNDLYTAPPSPPLLPTPPPPPSYPQSIRSPLIFTPTSDNNRLVNEENEPTGDFLLFSQWEDSDSDGGSQAIKRARLDSSDNILTQVIPDTQFQ